MKPYGIKIKSRRPMYDYGPDKYNSRGCFNKCSCSSCAQHKHAISNHTARKRKTTNVANQMRAAKKSARQASIKLCETE